MKLADAESRRRDKEAEDAATMRKIQLDQAGYTLVNDTVPSTDRGGFLAKVGHFLSGGSDEQEQHFTPIKDHESVDERDRRFSADTARTLETQRENFETGLHSADNANRLTEIGLTQSGEDRRSAASNATQRYVADTYAGSAQLGRAMELRQQTQAEKDRVIDDAIASASAGSANGTIDATRAFHDIPLDVRFKYGISGLDLNAGIVRFRDRKPALTREAIQQRATAAQLKRTHWEDILNPSNTSAGAPIARRDATGTSASDPSDADAWEHYRNQGLSAAEATARVKARSQSPSDALAEQRRAYDAASRTALAKGKNPVTLLGDRP
jgi:hypothetical protein